MKQVTEYAPAHFSRQKEKSMTTKYAIHHFAEALKKLAIYLQDNWSTHYKAGDCFADCSIKIIEELKRSNAALGKQLLATAASNNFLEGEISELSEEIATLKAGGMQNVEGSFLNKINEAVGISDENQGDTDERANQDDDQSNQRDDS